MDETNSRYGTEKVERFEGLKLQSCPLHGCGKEQDQFKRLHMDIIFIHPSSYMEKTNNNSALAASDIK